MVKFIVMVFFFTLISSCSLNQSTNFGSTQSSIPSSFVIKNHVTTPNKNDFPFFKLLSNKEVSILINQIKENPLVVNQLTANQVLNLLGNPIIIKKTLNLEIWQFRNDCVLNIVWKKHKNPTAYYLNNSEETNNFNGLDSNFTIMWINSIDTNKKSISTDKCIIKIITLQNIEHLHENKQK